MKNLYRQNEGSGVRRLAFATAVVVLVFVMDFVSGGLLRDTVRGVSVSIWSAGSQAIGSVLHSGVFSSRRALVEENQTLKEEIARLQIRAAGADALEEKMEALQDVVHLADIEPGITATIVSSRISSPYGTFMVGAGIDDGVAVGDLVLAGNGSAGFVLGRISDAGSRTSLVTEVFAPGVSVEAAARGIPIVVRGRGSGNARAEVSETFTVEVGDVVTSSQFRGRAVGVVGAVSERPASASKELHIHVPVSLSGLTFVYVVHTGT